MEMDRIRRLRKTEMEMASKLVADVEEINYDITYFDRATTTIDHEQELAEAVDAVYQAAVKVAAFYGFEFALD